MSFEQIDITHKPKRMQGDSFGKDSVDCSVISSTKGNVDNLVLPPLEGYITLEKAIDFYEKNSKSTKDIFYLTSTWLKDLLLLRKSAIKAAREKVQVELEEE